MRSFNRYLKEGAKPAWTESLSTALFDLGHRGIGEVRIPLSPSIFKRIWPKSIRSTAFHVTDYQGIQRLIKMQGGKRSISAFYNMDYDMISYGIRTEGGYVAELEGDVLAAAADDIASAPDKSGRRWITLNILTNRSDEHPPGFGGRASLKGIDQDIEEMMMDIIMKYADDPKFMPDIPKSWKALGREYANERKILSEIIRDYIDGMEKVMKKYSRPLRSVLTDYTKKRIQEPDPDSGDLAQWDELVVNNFTIKKIHVGQDFADDFRGDDALDMYGLPFETWDDDADLSDYIAKIVSKKL